MRIASASILVVAVLAPATALSEVPLTDWSGFLTDWSGFSIGGAGGIAFGNAHSDVSGRIATFSGFGAIYAEYNVQLQNGLVLGLASGISPAPGLFGNASRPCPQVLCQGLPATTEFHTQVNWFADVRLRVGYALGRFLPYMTGGFGFGEGKATATTSVFDIPVSEREVNSNLRGGVFGGGLQYGLTDHLSVDALYLRVQASANRVPNAGIGANALRVGLDYRF